jgi:hypothetical protein
MKNPTKTGLVGEYTSGFAVDGHEPEDIPVHYCILAYMAQVLVCPRLLSRLRNLFRRQSCSRTHKRPGPEA